MQRQYSAQQPFNGYEKGGWDVDTAVIATRLQKLDAYVQHLLKLQQVSIDGYLASYETGLLCAHHRDGWHLR